MTNLVPKIYHINKTTRMTSQDALRKFKRMCPRPFKKMGHFGTLDPFACGVLLVGVNGASRLNNYIHEELSKTYLAIGKLGIDMDTGDYTGKISKVDDEAQSSNIPNLEMKVIDDLIKKKLLGEYWQAPHMFSASKFEGKPLYEWAREGVEIKKDKKRRFIHNIEVVKYKFPYLIVRAEVSSGTFIRTLFSDIAGELGTVGHLVSLVRENVGPISFREGMNILKPELEIQETPLTKVLDYPNWVMNEEQERRIRTGSFVKEDLVVDQKYWALNNKGDLVALVTRSTEVKPLINFLPL